METERLNGFRLNWVFCSFDLPTFTKEDRKKASDFRKMLIKNGFSMFQYSVYARPCPTHEHADAILNSIYNTLPHKGNIILFKITDKQFARIQMIFANRKNSEFQSWKLVHLF